LGARTFGEKEVPIEPSITAEINQHAADTLEHSHYFQQNFYITTSILQILQE